jgi:hypothetical protein
MRIFLLTPTIRLRRQDFCATKSLSPLVTLRPCSRLAMLNVPFLASLCEQLRPGTQELAGPRMSRDDLPRRYRIPPIARRLCALLLAKTQAITRLLPHQSPNLRSRLARKVPLHVSLQITRLDSLRFEENTTAGSHNPLLNRQKRFKMSSKSTAKLQVFKVANPLRY